MNNLSINHFTGLSLDAEAEGVRKEPGKNEGPLFNFHTENIEEAYAYVEQQKFKNVSRSRDLMIYPRIPDGNRVMIYEKEERLCLRAFLFFIKPSDAEYAEVL